MSVVDWLVPGPVHAVLGTVLAAWLLTRRRRRGLRGLRAALVIAWAAWIWIGATPGLGNLLVRALESRYPALDPASVVRDEASEVIVLASGQMFRPDGTPAPVLDADGWERLRAGLALWRRTGGFLVLAGGPGTGESDSFAGRMRQVALEAGVPEAAIRRAAGSRNTFEDLQAVARTVGTDRRPPTARRYLVTSALHLPRAMAVAQQLGLVVEPVPCGWRRLVRPTWRAWLPDNGEPALWRDGLHEWIGLAVYRWKGWAAAEPAPGRSPPP